MTDPTFHVFLVEHAKFPFPECLIGASTSSTGISKVDVGLLNYQWKALHAVRDNDLANKLCDALRTTLGEMTVTEDSRSSMLQWFLPALLGGRMVDRRWTKNPSEAHSKALLNLGVSTAAIPCLFEYDQSNFEMTLEQRVEGARSVVDFHALVDNKLVALVEAKSPSVMKQLGELLPQNAFKIRWTAGSTSLVSLVFSKAALDLGLRKQEWLFLTCHNYWIVIRLVTRDSAPPFLAFSPLITMDDSSVPFRAFLGAVLSVVKGVVVEASVSNDGQILDIIDEEEGPPSISDANGGLGEYKVRSGQGPVGPGAIIHKHAHATSKKAPLMISSSSPLSPEAFQVWIHLHPFPNNIFDIPPIFHTDKQRLWLTRFIGHGSTGSVWECHFDNSEEPFAVKVVEMLRSSDLEARQRLRNEFDVYMAMENAYQSGKLRNRIAPRCYGAFEGKYIDVLILDLHNTILDSWDHLKPQERLEIFKLVYDLHSLGIAHGDLEARNVVRTNDGKFLLIDFTQSSQHRSKKCVAQHITQSSGDTIPLNTYKCDELNMFTKLMA